MSFKTVVYYFVILYLFLLIAFVYSSFVIVIGEFAIFMFDFVFVLDGCLHLVYFWALPMCCCTLGALCAANGALPILFSSMIVA